MSKHVEEAQGFLEMACAEGDPARSSARAQVAQAEATLAMVEQQRIANLIALAGLRTISGSPVSDYADALRDVALTALAEYRYTPPDHEEIIVLPEIARALGLEVSNE